SRSADPLFLSEPAPTQIYTLSLHDALPIFGLHAELLGQVHGERFDLHAQVSPLHGAAVLQLIDNPLGQVDRHGKSNALVAAAVRSEEHTSELQSRENLVCRLLLEKKK